ncbi:MAG TPA: alcohol dehydrogenase catalytic domain-containing protein [Acidimicrobiales bacterium]|nr:alcohol dehydrogenase catalytic domain-containing protein [Acidimicrobiales bacterium]
MGETMTAFIKRSAIPGDAAVGRTAMPTPGPREALVRVAACGICGSDLHTVRSDPGYEWIRTPMVIGHECAGTVVAVGDGTSLVAAGARVVPISIQGCLRCTTCRTGATQLCPDRRILGLHYGGGLGEYTVIPEEQLVPVPEGVDLRRAALTEPLTVAVHAVLGRSDVRPTSRVVVSGPGPIGQLCAQVARASGGEVLVVGARRDVERRLEIAARLGFRTGDIETESSTQVIRRHFGRRAPDVWIEASGAIPALGAAVDAMAPGGSITVVAMFTQPYQLMIPDILRREITMATTYAASASDYNTALQLIADDVVDVEPLIDEFTLSEAGEAFEAAASARAMKPLVVPDAGLS